MSQSRMRKVLATGDGGRTRTTIAKASGDTVACTAGPNPETLRSRSKNKIPKSVRYDLENALVSLCDVWFEEIKPHLVRNNIKLHVHGSSAGGDHERAPSPAPAAPPAPLPPAAPGCSHLDPGAAPDHPRRLTVTSAGCCSTPPTASRAPCAKLLTRSLRCPLSPLPSLPQTPQDCTQAQSHKCEEKQLKRPRTRRKKCRFQPQPQSSWRVPRLCRTYSVLCPAATGSCMRRIASHLPPQPSQPLHRQYYRFMESRLKPVMKNSSTQTELAVPKLGVSVGCQWGDPEVGLCSSALVRRTSVSLQHALGSLSSPRQCIYRRKRTEQTCAKEIPLFQDDLIDIIGEENDKRLRLLYSSPEKDEYPSFMNLVPSPPDRHRKPGGLKKSPPWR